METHDEPRADWAALPRDILLDIFGRLRQADILRGAGLACAAWRRAAVEEPTLWRTIDVDFNEGDRLDTRAWEARLAMGRAAVDRSAGQCESFRGIVDRDLLAYLAAGAPSLRSLYVRSALCLPEAYFDRVVTKLPMLERLVLPGGLLLRSTLLGLIQHCPRLEVLDASQCTTDMPIEYDVFLRCHRTCCNLCFCFRCFIEGTIKRKTTSVIN